MVLPGCLFVCHLILLPMCFLFNSTTEPPMLHIKDFMYNLHIRSSV